MCFFSVILLLAGFHLRSAEDPLSVRSKVSFHSEAPASASTAAPAAPTQEKRSVVGVWIG